MVDSTDIGSIGAFGVGANGQANLGPYGFLPQEPGINSPSYAANGQLIQAGDTSGLAAAGGESLNQMEYGGSAAGSSSSPAGFSPGTGSNTEAQDYLQGVVSGQNEPYSAATQAAELTNASNMNSAAEGTANQTAMNQAVAGGAASSDPSMAGVTANNAARDMSANSAAGLSIAENASVANEQAQSQAAESLQGDAQRQAQIAEQEQQIQNQEGQFQEKTMLGMMGGGNNPQPAGGYQGGQDPWTDPTQPQGFAPQPAAGAIDQSQNMTMMLPDGTYINDNG